MPWAHWVTTGSLSPRVPTSTMYLLSYRWWSGQWAKKKYYISSAPLNRTFFFLFFSLNLFRENINETTYQLHS